MSELTVPQIKELLTEQGIEFKANAKKDDLLKLLENESTETPKEYVVVVDWTDLQDNNHVYRKDDPFPREGVEVSDERIEELSTTKNRRKEVLIKEVADR